MTRRTTLVVAAVLAIVVLAVLSGRAPERPSGPAGSSYATAPQGLAAYAELLQRAGHDVRRVREPLDERRPAPNETIVLVDGDPLPLDERAALRGFVRAGGRALVGGSAVDAFEDDGDAGIVRLPGAAAALRNATLADGDHAATALALAGPPTRRVAFVESVHGYAPQTGLAALPRSVRTCLILLGVAALAFLVVCGRRLGPPEDAERDLAPPRRAHVEALAAALARTKDKDTISTTPTEGEPT